MGKGDRKTRKGKISAKTYGVLRPKKTNKTAEPVTKKKKGKK